MPKGKGGATPPQGTNKEPTKRTSPAAKKPSPHGKAKPGTETDIPVVTPPSGRPTVRSRTWPGYNGKTGQERIWIAVPADRHAQIMDRQRIGPTFGAFVRKAWGERPSKSPPQATCNGPWRRVAIYLPAGSAKEISEFENGGEVSFDLYILSAIEAQLAK